MKYIILVLSLLLCCLPAGLASADRNILNQAALGVFFPTDSATGVDPAPGIALTYTLHNQTRAPVSWYASAEFDMYLASATWALAPITAWALTLGPTAWDKSKNAYVGAGVGLSGAEADLPGNKFAWELVAGTGRRPVSVQLKYRDGGISANTGVTASVAFTW